VAEEAVGVDELGVVAVGVAGPGVAHGALLAREDVARGGGVGQLPELGGLGPDSRREGVGKAWERRGEREIEAMRGKGES
jgi:hypothetical protein